ncbi:MAG: recombinase family protein [Candidatus Thiodiazotropha taylori]
MKVARIYQRVSTKEQDLTRQASIEDDAKAAGFYIAGVYKEQASGARADRPELLRMIKDLQPGEVVIAEKIDRISRLPLKDAEKLIDTIKSTGAKLAIPGVVDLSELVESSTGVAKVVLEAVQDMLLKLSLQIARDDYEDRRERQRQGIELAKSDGKFKGRAPDLVLHERVIALRSSGETISRTAKLANCSESQVKRIWKKHKMNNNESH